MTSNNRRWFAALPRISLLIAVFLLTSCTVPTDQAPTVTLIVFPTLAPGETQQPPAPGETAIAENPTAAPGLGTETIPGVPTEMTPGEGLLPTPVIATPSPTATIGPIVHIVKPGESLLSIALDYGVLQADIQKANNLSDPNLIFVGQQLIIPTGGVNPNCKRDATFVQDITITDNTAFRPGQKFTKTWRFKNTGTCPWDNTFTVVFGLGNQMGANSSIPLPEAAPGAEVNISIDMVAPPAAGRYFGTWFIRGPDGVTFGTNPFVVIQVIPLGTPLPPSPTPRPLGPATIPPISGLDYPTISGVTLNSRLIWLKGKELGNRRGVFAKIGDSLSDEPWFLHNIGNGQSVWGTYGSLQPVAEFFRKETARTSNSFSNTSVATHGGWDSFDALDPVNSTPWDFCGSDSPIVCELRMIKPSVALIMFGTNEAPDHLSSGAYEANLRQMVQICIDRGVIPVLYTIPWNKFREPQPFNNAIAGVARQYDIPLVNYFAVVDPLPNRGISGDGVHPSVPPDQNSANFTGDNLKYGYTQRNLVTLQVLDLIWRLELYE